MNHQVFVYGTLLSDFCNHRLLETSKFIGPAVAANVRLYDVGPFPAVLPSPAGTVHGELYEVDDSTLTRLDRLEGVPHLYRRDTIQCYRQDGSQPQAYIYLWAGSSDRLTPIPCGDYKEYRQNAASTF